MKGFGLIEMVMVMVILSIIAALGSKMMGTGFDAFRTQRDISQLDWQGRVGLNRMVLELRSARSATAADLTISPTTEITFVDTSGTSIRYYRDTGNNQLMRKEDSNTAQALADNVTSLSFDFLDQNGTTTATVTDVRYISIDVSANLNNFSQQVRSTISPRKYQ